MRIAPIVLTILVGFVFQLSEARLIAQTQKPDSRPTLYQRLGAYDGVSSYIALVFPRVAQHPELSHMFRGHGTDSQHRQFQLVVEMVCQKTQTLTEIAAEKNSTIIFPLPIDLLKVIREATANRS